MAEQLRKEHRIEYFREEGTDRRDVEKILIEKYGQGWTITKQRSVRQGGLFGLFGRERLQVEGYIKRPPLHSHKTKDLDGEKKRILEILRSQQVPTANGSTTGAHSDIHSLKNELMGAIQSLETKISQTTMPSSERKDHDSIEKLRQKLLNNDFSYTYSSELLARISRDCTLEQLEDIEALEQRLSSWIFDDIAIHRSVESPVTPRVVVLVGPTGVGKTTTIAKLAAHHSVLNPKKKLKVRIVTIDNYRIGALTQIETYGDIMNIPVSSANSAEELRSQLVLAQEADLVFIDTIGKSPRDMVKLGEMRNVIQGAGQQAEVHLAMSATTKCSDMQDIMQQFEPFGYNSVVITKLDETSRVGGILSALKTKSKPVSYLTTGQSVPQDVEPASVMAFAKRLEGLLINYEALEQQSETRGGAGNHG